MGRNRVLSFMSQFSAGTKTPPLSSSPPNDSPYPQGKRNSSSDPFPDHDFNNYRPVTPPSRPDYGTPVDGSPATSPPPRQRSTSRPSSMVFAHQPPSMDVTEDTIPELQPIFSYLNSHSNKLYQEGYFLKLDDQNTQGKPNPDRTWTECFAQLVGTVLSLWDAAELDAAGEDGEVLPKFINLTDASIKMIESLPTRSSDEQPLQNILSISTAGRNRYLLHFNSHHSLIQWTAGIRLAIYEHTTLQEAYTGALIAGKGKSVNNINVIMERSRFPTQEWVRVRFGAGVPWRRCWCVITPPDEKEYAKQQKELKKNRSAYDRSHVPTLKGTIKFYDTRKDGKKQQKKAQPIASITDAYSAYAIYPQSKSLVDASTLLKIEGNVSVHTDPPSSSEGFVFIMPEVHPAVSGFEMLLRFLFPTWDTFGLYGRPGRLVASVLDSRSLMFAMPKSKRYGYLEPLDVSNLILEDGGTAWNEKEWRKRLKDATKARMDVVGDRRSTSRSRSGSRKSVRLSFGDTPRAQSKPRVGFSDSKGSVRSSRSFSLGGGQVRNDSAPPDSQRGMPIAMATQANHARNSSDPNVAGGGAPYRQEFGRSDSPYSSSPQRGQAPPRAPFQDRMAQNDYMSSDDERNAPAPPQLRDLEGMRQMHTPEPVSRPPAFNHAPQGRPVSKAYHSPELRRANSRLSNSTLDQLARAGGISGSNYSDPSRDGETAVGSGPSVLPNANSVMTSANDNRSREALSPPNQNAHPGRLPPPLNLSNQRPRSPMTNSPYGPPSPYGRGGSNPPSRPGTADGRRSPMPPGPPGPPGPPRSPHPQNPNYRPDQGRPPQDFRPGGPPDGRGRPPNHRGPPNGPPPHGPPRNVPYGNYPPPRSPGPPRPPGSPGPRGPPGPPGPHGPPMQMAYRQPPPPDRGHHFENQKPSTMSGSSAITTNEIIDHYAFDQGRAREPPRQGTPGSERRPPPPQRQGSGTSSHYDDDSSARSIDYASTHKSSETGKSVPRPRAGVLKTVGGDEPEVPTKPNFDIPEINFGPTINYGASPSGPKTSSSMVSGGTGQNQRPYTPTDQRSAAPIRKPVGSPPHHRQESDEVKRTMAWQPGHATTGSGTQGLSAEQYVQHKAAHARSASGTSLQSLTPSPGMNRTTSSEMLGGRHSRNSSTDKLSRPGSRSANSAMNWSGSSEVSSHLSAREQEQVARMTGSPLINVGHKKVESQGTGLVGAIEAREREKQQNRPGAQTQAVQQAIAQRQQQQAAMAYQQQMAQQQMAQQQLMQQQLAHQQQMAQQIAQQQAYQQQVMAERSMSAQGMHSTMGPPQGGPQQASPPGAYGQPASFSRPLRSGPQPPQQVDPRSLPPQGQYSPVPGTQGTPRNVHPQYQGQAF